MKFCRKLKRDLEKCIHFDVSEMSKVTLFPGRAFTRKRKLTLEGLIWYFLSLQASDLETEVAWINDFDPDSITASGFRQQRDKLLPSALETVYERFTQACFRRSRRLTYAGYRVFACDGSDFRVVNNPKEPSTYCLSSKSGEGYNLVKVNALYDVMNHIYGPVLILPKQEDNERRAAVRLIRKHAASEPVIYVMDRGYECYTLPMVLTKLHQYYVIRAQSPNQNGILKGLKTEMAEHAAEDGTFDFTFQRNLIQQNDGKYTRDDKAAEGECLTLRVAAIQLNDHTLEYVLTNLPDTDATSEDLKAIYHLRWGIETSFRHLKYDIGGKVLHAKAFKHYIHELYAAFILYNFCSTIIMHYNQENAALLKKKKHTYRINFRQGIRVCRKFLTYGKINVEKWLLKRLVAIREGRSEVPRGKIQPQRAVSFQYRF